MLGLRLIICCSESFVSWERMGYLNVFFRWFAAKGTQMTVYVLSFSFFSSVKIPRL
jgi:hypothetical protein